MVTGFESIPDPSDDEMYIATAEEYIESIGKDPTDASRALDVKRRDVQHEIDAQVVLIDDLVTEFWRDEDDSVAEAIERAKIELGQMLVDKGNLPPS